MMTSMTASCQYYLFLNPAVIFHASFLQQYCSLAKEEKVEREERVEKPQQARRHHNLEVPRLDFNFQSVVFTVS
jgi:hypothetical protein